MPFVQDDYLIKVAVPHPLPKTTPSPPKASLNPPPQASQPMNTELDICTVHPYKPSCMRLRSIHHKGLKRLIEENDGRGIRADLLDRTRKILTAVLVAEDVDGVQGPPGWRMHQLAGDRSGTWSISVSGNWRITFDIDGGAVSNLDLEDYH